MDFRPLLTTERDQLLKALLGNAEGKNAIRMNPKDTTFAGVSDEVTDEEVVSAVKSVPTHY